MELKRFHKGPVWLHKIHETMILLRRRGGEGYEVRSEGHTV